jgi:hypothetical protein
MALRMPSPDVLENILQNTSHAVMAQRAEPHDSLDYFPTPLWATRALCERIPPWPSLTAWEPACGEGHMVRPLREYFGTVHASDIHDYGFGEVDDFLIPNDRRADWIITNPPFRLAEQFVKTAYNRANIGVAVLVRTAFLESVSRYHGLFNLVRPALILQFAERVPMHKGRLVEGGSTATAYCWIVWRKGLDEPTRFEWIAPCRRRLEKPGDYEARL